MHQSLSWQSIDYLTQMLCALEGYDVLPVAIARFNGSKKYKIVVQKAPGHTEELACVLEKYPDLKSFAKESGLFLDEDEVSNFVKEQIQDNNWSVTYNRSQKWTQTPWRRIKASRPQSPPWSAIYWREEMRINSETSLGKIKNLLLSPFSPKAEKEAAKLIAILLKNRPNWESYAEQSLRCFAQNDKSWHRFLDKFEISHRYRHEGAHGLFWAIVNGWDKWLDGWKKETGLGLSFVPLVQDAPPAWILEDFPPSGSLWHWLGAYGPTSLLKSQSLDDLHKQDNFARTPLHWACRYGNIENIKWLVDQGFDLGQEDVLGKVACEYLPQGSKELDEVFNWMEDRRQKNTKALEK